MLGFDTRFLENMNLHEWSMSSDGSQRALQPSIFGVSKTVVAVEKVEFLHKIPYGGKFPVEIATLVWYFWNASVRGITSTL